MAIKDPVAELQPKFSAPDATPTPWTKAQERLEAAELYWLSTVRPDVRSIAPVVFVGPKLQNANAQGAAGVPRTSWMGRLAGLP